MPHSSSHASSLDAPTIDAGRTGRPQARDHASDQLRGQESIATMADVLPLSPTLAAHWRSQGIDKVVHEHAATLGRPSGRRLESSPATVAGIVEVGELLAAGGMGEVRHATQPRLKRAVAIKRARPDAPEGSEVEMLREAWVAGALEHPNILPIHTLAREGDVPLIVMKRVDGQVWTEVLAADFERDQEARPSHERPWHTLLEPLIEVCRAVHFAHTRGVLHLDLKPDNVMLGGHGEVVVLDWGIAAAWDSERAPSFLRPAAEISTISGTPGYLSPEQAEARGDQLSPATDVYLLGAILHQIITGRAPHEGTLVQSLVSSHIAEPPAYGPEVPVELALVATRALAREPAERYPDVESFREALERFLEHRPALPLLRKAEGLLVDIRRVLRADGPPRRQSDDGEEAAEGATERAREQDLHTELNIDVKVDECRFALQQALRCWPSCEVAEAHLSELCDLLLAQAERRLDPLGARVAVDDHPAATAEHRARVDRLIGAAAADAKRVQALRELSQDEDVNAHRTVRIGLALAGGLLWLVWNLVVGELDRRGTLPITNESLVVNVSAAASVFLLFLAFGGRRALMTTAVNRRALTLVLSTFAMTFVLWVGAWILGIEAHRAAALSGPAYVLAAMALAVILDARTWWVSISMLVPTVLGAVFPAYVFHFISLLGPLGGAGLVLLWWRPREAA